MNRKNFLTLILCASCGINFALCSAAFADTTGDATIAAGASTDDSTADASKRKSGDQHIESEITAAQQVVLDLEQCCKHLHRTAGDLINEATRQQLQVVATADDVGPILLAPPITGVMPVGGFLPCRKKFIDLFMNQLHDIVPMTIKEAGEIELDDESRTATISDALSALKSTSGKLKDQVDNLDKLTDGPEYDNTALYKEAKALQEQVANMSSSCKTLSKELKREDRGITKELHLLEKEIQNKKTP